MTESLAEHVAHEPVVLLNGEVFYDQAMRAIILLVSHRLISDTAGRSAVKALMRTTFDKVIEQRRRTP